MKKIIPILLLTITLFSCWEKELTAEEKFEESIKADMKSLQVDLVKSMFNEEELIKKSVSLEDDMWKILLDNMSELQINQVIENWWDVTVPQEVVYSISIFDNDEDLTEIKQELTDAGFRVWEEKDVFGMMMFDAYKTHALDMEIIAKNEAELKIIVNVEYLSYDWWFVE